MDGPRIDMARVATLAAWGLPPGTPCYVTMSGGNCATIYVGLPYKLTPFNDDAYPVLAGPGTYLPLPPRAYPEEFSVGYDQDFDGDERRTFERPHPTLTREERAAFAIVEIYRNHPSIKPVQRRGVWVDPITLRELSVDECVHLGIDLTGGGT